MLEPEEKDFDDKFIHLKAYITTLEKEQIKYQNIILSSQKEMSQLKSDIISLKTNLEIKDQNINQSKEILSTYKNNITLLESKVQALEKENEKLNHTIIELTQKLISQNKSEEDDSKIIFDCKADELEALVNKLKFDKKRLESKILEITQKDETDLNLLKTLKQTEINQKDKIIQSQKQIIKELKSSQNLENYEIFYKNESTFNYNSIQTMLDQVSLLEGELQNSAEEIFSLKKTNNNLSNEIIEKKIELEHKDNIINSLQNITKENLSDFQNNLKEAQIGMDENEKQLQMSTIQMQKLTEEKNELLSKNEELLDYVNKFNDNIQLAEQQYLMKVEEYNNYYNTLKAKNDEYKGKIRQLKLRVDELYEENIRLKKELKIGLSYVQNIDTNIKANFTTNSFQNNSESFRGVNDSTEVTGLRDIRKSLEEYKAFLKTVDSKIKKYKIYDEYS